jgi:hypothetical protein
MTGIDRLLDKKYGLMKKMVSLMSSRRGQKDTILKVTMRE